MASEVLFDTSGFFALMDKSDLAHERAVRWVTARGAEVRPITSEWIIGETCTLLVARKRPHLLPGFLDYIQSSVSLLVVNPDEILLNSAKQFIRRHGARGYSFVDCLSFCLMKERRIVDAFTTDEHFRKAGFSPLLAK